MTGETILITRPKGDEGKLADALQSRGYRVIHEPLTEIFLRHTERAALEKALLAEPDAVIATSKHGVNALALLTELRDLFLLCVGEATAAVAESLGFNRVTAAGGNVQKLIEYIYGGYDAGTRFLYVSGTHTRVELEAVLAAQGMQAEQLALYEAVASARLSDTVTEQLRRGQIDAATFLSPRAGRIFTCLLKASGESHAAAGLHGVALSGAVAQSLGALPWKDTHIANEATLASLIDCVDNIFHG